MFLSLLMPVAAQCADTENDNLFDSDEEDDFLAAIPTQQTKTEAPMTTLSEFLMQNITAATALPVNKAEKVFCYIVDYAEKGYEGYTANGLAIKGYCGELSAEGKALIKETLFNSSSLYSKSKADCRINPKIMLRYVYGIDYTDILLSSPCPSLTFFHGSNIAALNAAPAAMYLITFRRLAPNMTGMARKKKLSTLTLRSAKIFIPLLCSGKWSAAAFRRIKRRKILSAATLRPKRRAKSGTPKLRPKHNRMQTRLRRNRQPAGIS